MTQNCLPIVDWLKNWFTSTEDLLDKTYPVGSIYMSVNSTSPSTLFGGTWVQLEDTFLYATSTTADANVTTAPSGQGSKDAVVVEHNHTQSSHNHKPSDSSYNFITAQSGTNFALYAKHGLPTTSGNYCTMYASSQGTVNEPNTTGNAQPTINNNGESGVGKNMPPYMKVYMWKRTA